MDTVMISGAEFDRLAVKRAATFWERFRGLRSPRSGGTLLLEASSIHTFGLRGAIGAIGINDEAMVIGSRVVPPNRVCRFKGARQILEVSATIDLPRPGERLVIEAV